MKTVLFLDNIKCHGCANSIGSKLKAQGLQEVDINVEEGSVSFDHTSDEELLNAQKMLKSMGYPERDASDLGDKARSYISCMIGRIKKS